MSKLKIKTLKDKPHKVYSTQIEIDYQMDELCKFLNNHKDKTLDIIINGKQHKFNSIASRKKFVEGFREANRIKAKQSRLFIEHSQESINKLTGEITQLKRERQLFDTQIENLKYINNTKKLVADIRVNAWQDKAQELSEICETLWQRLERIEPLITNLRNAKSEGDLNAIHMRIKKEKI